MVFQFDYLDGQLMITNTKIAFDKIDMKKLLDENDNLFSTYWVNLGSTYDMNLGVSISFQPKNVNEQSHKKMKIGIGNQGSTRPLQEFLCYQPELNQK